MAAPRTFGQRILSEIAHPMELPPSPIIFNDIHHYYPAWGNFIVNIAGSETRNNLLGIKSAFIPCASFRIIDSNDPCKVTITINNPQDKWIIPKASIINLGNKVLGFVEQGNAKGTSTIGVRLL